MSKAEKFIIDSTKNYSNEKRITVGKLSHWEKQPWLTPDDARMAVEIAREEMIEWINSHWREYINVDADGVVCFGHWKNDLIKAMKNE